MKEKVQAWDFEDGIIVWGTHDLDEAELAVIAMGKEQGIPVVTYEHEAEYDGEDDVHYNLHDLQHAGCMWGHRVLVEQGLEIWPPELMKEEPFEDSVPYMVVHF